MTTKKPTKKTRTSSENEENLLAVLSKLLVMLLMQALLGIRWFFRDDHLALALKSFYHNLYRILAYVFVTGQMTREMISKLTTDRK